MIIVEEGARKIAPLRLNLSRRENHFLYEPSFEMVDWYYSNSTTVVLDYEDLDDKCSLVSVLETFGDSEKRRSFTIGKGEKKLICENYNFYHRG